ncbi:Mut7-C RNAse domain-containing protein [Blastococcus sp. BMG 814]|uniref:Mut7-C RNAse domain-containing protein n=1 Tax=Blastococcus carthaginiensis TaxID=3050034 RepID=A0ABT9IIH5_9ACTN|nr:Mut7-C RNAse domain-containing protein [Blastococcus carthaginiensis]MDP5185377.1 Mut7-C RNAse domain-containing protein [Blastococcus carthaginiensis]
MEVRVRPAPDLRWLLAPRYRGAGERPLPFDPDATVGHLVQAAGIPLTEAGAIRADGAPVTTAARVRPGTVLEVEPVPRPVAVPPGGFLLDVGLGALARRLRLLGIDAAWSNDADDPALVARAAAEERVLLTQDRGLLMRRALPHGALVRGGRPDEQLDDVLDRFAVPLAPLTRCTACGAALHPVPKEEVADLLEPGTRRSYDAFSRCPGCGRVYWHGAHGARIDALVERARRGGRGRQA